MIHETAIIDPKAKISDNVKVGAFSVIGPDVVIGKGTEIQSHVSITGDTISTSDIFGGISGAIRNPNVEVLFQKMNLRTFDLTFKLVPYNPTEAKTIQSIISVFKKSMLPTYKLGQSKVLGTKGDDNAAVEASFIKVPKVCKVTYMHGDQPHPVLPTYKMCAITDMGINFTHQMETMLYSKEVHQLLLN